MRKGISPALLIGIVALAFACFFVGLIVAASLRSPSAPPATAAPGGAATAAATSAAAAAPTIALAALQPVTGETYFSLDKLNQTSLLTTPVPPITVGAGEAVTLSGWAVDTRAGKAAGGVLVVIDGGQTVEAKYGMERGDVATALKSGGYAKSGFVATVGGGTLPAGKHELTIRIVTADGRGYYAPTQAITITVA
jgi:hypothetical protein